jgi:CRISPR-associated protein Csm2
MTAEKSMANEAKGAGPKNDLEAIIKYGDADRLVHTAEKLGGELHKADLTKSQIRNIYATVKMIAATRKYGPAEQYQIHLLIYKLQYAAARQPALKRLAETLSQGIEMLGDNPEHFYRFADFFEAIVAYHYSARETAALNKRTGGR